MVQAYLQFESGSNFNSTTGLLSNGSAVLLFDNQYMFNSSNEFQISIAGKWTHSNKNNLLIFSLANKNDSTAGYSCYTHSEARTSAQFGYVRNDNGNANTATIIKNDSTDLVDVDKHFSVKFTQGSNSVTVQGYNVSEDGSLSALGQSTYVKGTGNPKLNKIVIEASANFKPNLYSIQILSGLGDFAGHYIAKEARTYAGTKIQLRHDTAANWTSINPVLAAGEMGVETDTNKFKFGDGTTAWVDLPYATSGSSGGGSGTQLTSADGTTEYSELALGDTLAVSNGVLNANLDSKQDKLEAGKGISIDTVLEGSMTPDWYLNGAKLDPVPDTINTPAMGVINTYLPYNNQTFSNTVENITINWETLYAYTSSFSGCSIQLNGSDGYLTFDFDGGYKGANSTLQITGSIDSSTVLSPDKLYIPYQADTYIRNIFTFNKITNTWKYKCINTNTKEIIISQTGTTTVNIIPTNSVVSIVMKNVNSFANAITVKTSSFNVAGSAKKVTKINAKPDNKYISFNSNGELTTSTSVLTYGNFLDFCHNYPDEIKAALGLN